MGILRYFRLCLLNRTFLWAFTYKFFCGLMYLILLSLYVGELLGHVVMVFTLLSNFLLDFQSASANLHPNWQIY